jgi:transcriptional regulator with XRE-family HTH domain
MTDDALATIGPELAAARERAGFSQEEVGLLVGQPRTVVSNWETDVRRPSARDLERLATIYRTSIETLLGHAVASRPEFEKLLFRDAGDRLDAQGKYEIQRFLGFLDDYAEVLQGLGEQPGLAQSPFSIGEGFYSKDDIRRRADEARHFLGVGEGPIGDLVGTVDASGVSVYFAPLGLDLAKTVSGAFVPHADVGFSIVVNSQTTPGRRKFTLAHELAHALFQGNHHYVGYFGRREAAERFANAFASEFLVPIAALRALVESLGISRVAEPEVVVYLQRYFGVSYGMMLVRLRAANLANEEEVAALRLVRPLQFAEALGYTIEADERVQNPDTWGLTRFPRRFLRLLRRALKESVISVSRAAAMTGVAHEDVEEFLTDLPPGKGDEEEFEYIAASG